MKTFYLAFLCLFINSNAFTQYTLSTSTNPYTELANPISISQGNVWNHTTVYTVNFNFNFEIYGETYTSLTVNAGGGLDFIGTTTKTLNVFYPAVPSLPAYQLNDRGSTASQSPISYEITGIPGNRILKIQWKNAGFRQTYPTSDPSDFVNYQVWLFEIDNRIEIRFGSRQFDSGTFNGSNNITLGIRWIFDSCSNFFGVKGQANAATHWIYNACFPNYTFIYGTPDSSVTYIINPSIGTTIEKIEAVDFKLFPNPVKNNIYVSSIGANIEVKEITICDVIGKRLLTTNTFSKASNQICLSMEDFTNGVFFLKIETEDGRYFVRKILKQSD